VSKKWGLFPTTLPVAKMQRRTSLQLLLVMHGLLGCNLAAAKFCYVGELEGRVWDTEQQQAVECPAAIYGDSAACAFACARDRVAKTDVCSFFCLPGQHCSDEGLVHPVSTMSPGHYLPDCPQQVNFETVDGQEDKLDCVSRCCKEDRCNVNAARPTHRTTSGMAGNGVAVALLTVMLLFC